ncbi:MAG: choice-of-anchor J domain-containing protein [candidate division WOR-3 bacterium]
MIKKGLIGILVPIVLLGINSIELTSHPQVIKCQIYEDNTEIPIRFDTTRIFPPPTPTGVFRDVATGKNFKGPLDDTVRIFTVMSGAPHYAMLFNDTTANPPLKVATAGWQRHGNNGRYIDSSPVGFWGAAVGDVDNDDITDMVYGEDTVPCRLFRAYWNGTSWTTESIARLSGPIRDIAIGDADNDGVPDIVVASGNAIYRIRRSGAVWLKDSIYAESQRISGVAIGNVISQYPGNEIIAVSYTPQIYIIRHTGSNWHVQPLLVSDAQGRFKYDDVVVGDFDPDSLGNEVIITNGYNFFAQDNGNIWIWYLYKFPNVSVYPYIIFKAYFHESGWGQESEVQIANVYDLGPGNEIILVPGTASGFYAVPMVMWRERISQDSVIYWIRALPNTGGTTFGVAVGDINKHRAGYTEELVITGNSRVYEYEQRLLYNRDLVARRITFEPNLVCEQESVAITLTVMNYGYDTLQIIPLAYEAPGRIVYETCYVQLRLGDSVIYQFRNKYYCQSAGAIYFKAYSCLANDQYPYDDTVTTTLSVKTRLEGTRTVGPGGDFPNLTQALNYFRNSIITGHVTFKLTDINYLSEALPLKCSLPVAYRESIWSLVIKPASAIYPTIQGNNASAIFEFVGISNVTLDSLNIINTNSSGAVVRFRRGAKYNKITNCKIQGSSSTTATGAVAFLAGDSTTGNNNNLIYNCEITRYYNYPLDYAIYFAGGDIPNDSNVIKKCKVYDFRNTGIYLKENTRYTVITECEIYTQVPQVSNYLCGITCYDYSVIGTKIIGNKIRDLYTLQSNATIKGIYLWEGSTEVPTLIANNFIILDGTVTHADATLYGIHEDTYLNRRIDIYYNSIYIGGTGLTSNKCSYGLYRNYPCQMNFKNNIIFNNRQQISGAGEHYAIYCANIYGTLESDYNDLYVTGTYNQYVGYWIPYRCASLDDWQSQSGRDQHSISRNPNYISISDLHINPNSPYMNKKATAIFGLTTDIDNETRDPYHPDIGADEYLPNPPQPFTLISPDSAATFVPINGNLIWHQSIASEYYEILLDTVNPPERVIASWYPDTICPFETLYASKTYYWQIKAYNDTVPSKALISSSIWHFTTVPLPSPPSNLRVTNLFDLGLELAWDDNSNDELGFYILIATSPAGNYVIIDSVPANVTTYLVWNLIPNTRYWLRVASYNQYGLRGYAQTDTITLAQIPGAVRLDSVRYRQIKLFLDPRSNPSNTRFCVKITDHSGNVKYLHTSGMLVDTMVYATCLNFGGENGLWVKGLYPNTPYTFNVFARNDNNIISGPGPSNTQTTLPPLPVFFSESFEDTVFPPFGWETEVITSGGSNWTRVTSGQYPSQLPYHGVAQAQYNAYQVPAGAHARLISPPISLVGVPNPTLKFYMYHNHTHTAPDSLVIEVSTDNGSTWQRKEKFLRYAQVSSWQLHTVDLAAESGQVVLLGFHGYSAGGNNIYIDSIAVVPITDVMVSGINRPNLYEYKRVSFSPQVVLTNNTNTGFNVPLIANIWTFAQGFYQGFDSIPFPPVYWVVYNNDLGNKTWQITNTAPHIGPGCAMSIGEGDIRNDDWLVTKLISINSNDTLKFYYQKKGNIAPCSLEVWLSTTNNALTSFNVLLDAFGINNTTYLVRNISLSDYCGQNVYIAFVNKSFSEDTIFLDEIAISYHSPELLYSDSVNIYVSANSSIPITFRDYMPLAEGQYRFFTYCNLPTDLIFWNNYQERIFEVVPIPLALIQPNNGQFTNDTTPTFIWHSVVGATQYRLQVGVDSSFENPVVDELVACTTYTVEPNLELADGRYFWRVRVNRPEPPDPYSEIWHFILDTEAPQPPTLSWPTPGFITNNTNPTFIWHKVPDGFSYQFFLYDSNETLIFTQIVTDTCYTLISDTLSEAHYYWAVATQDSAGNWSAPSPAWELIIDLTPPVPPELIAPQDGETIEGYPQLLIWHSVPDAVAYNVVITPSADSAIVNDTFYYAYLDVGTYRWKVRSQDLAGNWSEFCEPRSFNVFIGWVRKRNIPSFLANQGKFVKDGGALVSTDSFLYALRGNKSHEFYKYLPSADSWISLETLRFARSPQDPTKLTKKKVGKGAALCYDGDNKIYAIKGNGTRELWRYNILENSWELDTFVPPQSLKGGSALIYLNNKIYLLAGGQKIGEPNFFSYEPQTRIWRVLRSAPMEPDNKSFKDGSALAELNGIIYALKGGGKHNYFYQYDTSANNWTYLASESIPQVHPAYIKVKKTKVKDGAAMVKGDNRLFAIKGNKRNELWCYSPSMHRWVASDTIPRASDNFAKSVPSTGAALAFLNGRLYLLKGNNTNEFWCYVPHNKEKADWKESTASNITSKSNFDTRSQAGDYKKSIIVVPSTSTWAFYQNQAFSYEGLTVKLYNSLGQEVKTIPTKFSDVKWHDLVKDLGPSVYFMKYYHQKQLLGVFKLILE